MVQTPEVDIADMHPRFGRLTQALSIIFALAGLGACIAGLSSGHQTTPGTAHNGLILVALGATYLLVAIGLWVEYLWAWRVGLALTSVVVMVDLVRGVVDGGFVMWAVFMALFAASAAQGRRSRTGGN
jgi:hypothetical protein